MVVLSKLLPRGQVTLPRSIRREAGFAPGDVLTLRVTGEGTVQIKALPRLTVADLAARYPIDGPINEAVDRECWEAEAAKDVFGARDG